MKNTIRVMRHMMGLNWQADRRATLLIVLLVAFQAGAVALTGLSQRWVVDSSGLATVSGVLAAVAMGAFAHAMMATGNRIQVNLQADLTERVDIKVNEEILGHVSAVPTVEHLERPDILDRLATLRRSTKVLSSVGWRTANTCSAVVSVLLSLALLVMVHPSLALIALLAVPPLWTGQIGHKALRRARDVRAQHLRKEEALHEYFVSPENLKEVRACSSGQYLNEEASKAWEESVAVLTGAEVRATLWKLLGWCCYTAGFVGTLILVVQLVANGSASLGDLALVLALGTRVRGQVRLAVDNFTRVSEAGQVTEHFLWIGEYAADQTRTDTVPVPEQLGEGITLRGVGFAYPGASQPALRDVNLTLRPGTTVALVGDNGAGKSTLIKLLTGMHHPTEGVIEIDGTPMTSMSEAQWRERCSGTFQDFVKFELPVADAVALGRRNPPADSEDVLRALEQAGAREFTERLPEGTNTQLGHSHGGSELSHGQWQRLALARGLVRQDVNLRVLDEPTAALDPQAEHDLYESFAAEARSRPGQVTVLVSHRFSTVHMADLIAVLHEGTVVEHGRHEELMQQQGRYAQLFTAQARGYTDTAEDSAPTTVGDQPATA